MLYYLFQYLDKLDFPGSGMFQYVSFRAAMAAIIERYLLQATSASGHLVGSRLNACILALSAWLARTGHLRGD